VASSATLSENAFPKAVARAWEHIEHKQNLQGARVDAAYCGKRQPQVSPERVLLSDLKAPANLNPGLVERFLAGAGNAPMLRALLHWPHSHPIVTIYADNPMEAIGISIHLDRKFSKRRWVKCKCGCGNWLEQKRSTDCFYSKKCRNNFITALRRRKVRLVGQGHEAWKLLPAAKRKGLNSWAWIADWANGKRKLELDPAWVRRVISAKPVSRNP
jgi:hypothetical protein